MSQQVPPPSNAHGMEQHEFERLDNEFARIVDNAVGQVSPLLARGSRRSSASRTTRCSGGWP